MNNNENNNNVNVTPTNNPTPVNTNNNEVPTEMAQTVQPNPVVNPTVNVEPRVLDGSIPEQTNNVQPNIQQKETKEERLKRIENNYKPPSKAKTFLLIMFFILLIVFVLFLPDIATLVNKYKSGELTDTDEKIVDGQLVCELTSNSTNLTYNHKWTFEFTDNKLESLTYVTSTLGDISEDEKTLDDIYNKCNKLKEAADSINGLTVNCDSANGKVSEKQIFNYANIDTERLTAAYAEAGGNRPTYEYLQDMDDLEKDMNASGAKCKRQNSIN